ncbi:hypothetical protein cyc_05298 [Cyclospora cayetanensis]|uniref:Uncharacterized protein n=1 Tax=Cyclospora cayetanensis TaxID=88456 RepID=A0A1D3CUB5_9EIME|nr:hypothetical protein cyc_05298 [Cyclospora cayetanensis]
MLSHASEGPCPSSILHTGTRNRSDGSGFGWNPFTTFCGVTFSSYPQDCSQPSSGDGSSSKSCSSGRDRTGEAPAS